MSIWSKLKGRKKEESKREMHTEPQSSQALIREIAKEIDTPDSTILQSQPVAAPSSPSGQVVFNEGDITPVVEPVVKEQLSEKSYRSVLEAGLITKGTLYLEDGDCIEGEHHGEIVCTGELVVAAGSRVDAVVSCDVLKVHGNLNGQIKARSLVTIADQAEVSGSIVTPELEVEPGALVKGHLDMTGTN